MFYQIKRIVTMPIYKLIVLGALFVATEANASYKLPVYEKVSLSNGLTLYLMEQTEVPLIDINIVTKVGAVNDKKQAGLTQLTAGNLILGTKEKSKTELDNEIDFIGANLSSSANMEFSTIKASFAKKDLASLLPTLKSVLTTPRFEQQEFDKFKKRHLLQIEQAKESPKSVISNYFNRMIFGNQGYGAPLMGEKNTITAIKLNDIKAHHQKWYQPKNTAIIVVGDFDTKAIKQQLSATFASWQNTKALPAALTAKTTQINKAKVLLVDKADAIETTFTFGGKGIAQNNPDRVGLTVINTILGGRFTSWLNDALRVNAGLTYGARSRFNSFSQSGSFGVSTFTKTETTIEAIDLALATYDKLWQQGIDKETLDSAKAYVKGQFPPKFETSSQLANLLADMYGYDFNESYINNFEKQVNALTVEKSKALISKYFPKENLQFVVIGKADDIRNKISKYGEITEANIKDSLL